MHFFLLVLSKKLKTWQYATPLKISPILGYIFGECVKVYHNEPFHFFTIAVCKRESSSTGKNSCIIKWDECIMSCVTLEYYPTDEYKSDSDFWFYREQNVKPFIEGKRAAQMFSTEIELKILNSKKIAYGMILNVTQSKAKFIIQKAGRPLIPG